MPIPLPACLPVPFAPERSFVGMSAKDALREAFGHQEFRGEQEHIINHVVDGGSIMVLLATGGGKSLCYQVPALVRPGLCIVVSPLVSLMDDQVHGLLRKGVRAACLHSGVDAHVREDAMRRAREGVLDLLYVSPERLMTEPMRALVRSVQLSLVAVDECHVVSSWGHEFRPSYREVAAFLRHVPKGVPRIALTATADAITVDDVRQSLGLRDAPLVRTGFDRPNLSPSMVACAGKDAMEARADDFLREHRGTSGIIYCTTRKAVDTWTARLSTAGWPVVPYHAGMDSAARARAQASFMSTPDGVVVATIAFGMGIDKPDTRWVLHIGLPSSPEAWYQEIGRAGRDGADATCLLLWSEADLPRKRALMERAAREAEDMEAISSLVTGTSSESVDDPDFDDRWAGGRDHRKFSRQRFELMAAMARSAGCRRRAVLAYLDEDPSADCGNCDRCLSKPPTTDASGIVHAILSLLSDMDIPCGMLRACDALTPSFTELGKYGVSHYMLQCFAMGWLRMPPRGNGGFAVSQAGSELLASLQDNGEPVMLVPIPALLPTSAPTRKPASKQDSNESTVSAAVLAARLLCLRELISSVSIRHGLPTEMLMPAVLAEKLASHRPLTLDHLLVAGVPAATVMTCGAQILVALSSSTHAKQPQSQAPVPRMAFLAKKTKTI